jgi:hypothetical protein
MIPQQSTQYVVSGGWIGNEGVEREIWSIENDRYTCDQYEERNPMG